MKVILSPIILHTGFTVIISAPFTEDYDPFSLVLLLLASYLLHIIAANLHWSLTWCKTAWCKTALFPLLRCY